VITWSALLFRVPQAKNMITKTCRKVS